ncbi:hypothetical protein B0H14DRAFT_3128201 [Mycena olivaceomarginata]|nr:hypothetical protein B0H14DRAFT_3128201 [Mycena olivaceomarginata]
MGRKKLAHLEQVIEQGKDSVVNYVNEWMGGGDFTPSQLTAWLQSARRRNHPGIPGSRRPQRRHRSLANSLTSGSYQSTTQMPTSQEPSINFVNLVSQPPASRLPEDAWLASDSQETPDQA